jgi:hypothetical protein
MVSKSRSSTMKTMKTLMLAGVAAMSLGVGAAMAQEGGSGLSVPGAGFYRQHPAVTTQAPTNGMVQSGSSDPVSTLNPYNVSAQPQFDISVGGSGG